MYVKFAVVVCGQCVHFVFTICSFLEWKYPKTSSERDVSVICSPTVLAFEFVSYDGLYRKYFLFCFYLRGLPFCVFVMFVVFPSSELVVASCSLNYFNFMSIGPPNKLAMYDWK